MAEDTLVAVNISETFRKARVFSDKIYFDGAAKKVPK